jgi:hypothetical protein
MARHHAQRSVAGHTPNGGALAPRPDLVALLEEQAAAGVPELGPFGLPRRESAFDKALATLASGTRIRTSATAAAVSEAADYDVPGSGM